MTLAMKSAEVVVDEGERGEILMVGLGGGVTKPAKPVPNVEDSQ